MKRISLGLATLLACASTYSADIPLYPTGPEKDSAFLRFANGTRSELKLVAEGSKASLVLGGDKLVSDYLPVSGGSAPVKGVLSLEGQHSDLAVTVAPGEFVTVVALADAKGGIRQVVIHEQPDDFNALKASLAFINVDATCADASLEAVAQQAELFKKVAEGAVQRRMINPVQLSVQLKCAGAPVGQPLSFGLKAGERYSVFALPSATGSRLLFAPDSLAN
ncbi:Alginate O-acetyl transferase AlgF [Pseudomonas cedrina]|uniref:Alginate biosynthesis protein AlgF n=2 Tax=Pseudomonas cedrina TaxID=651740 RepID=A0A1V2KA15_PSECE|nr:alginate O-acetyltransferase AlgF [Pseudomonas cedrina]ONH54330.1 cell division protein FtsQ [Pseudomonas cedrina subsp. cedrina]SDT61560.1 Alginate O-acetyl transferase AlgF [Pseudomonas cedrina]